ncbi:TPA: hypothetical protein I7171_22245 [Vibrio vulnificus]|nr:hypothetical protein [Vibrio alginolyticus]HAS6199491.1 hypothetical protein [Vibrio vulnificus]
MENRSIEVFKEVSNAEQKFDYFVLGVAIALFAYIGKDYTPEPLGMTQNTFELFSVIMFFLSVLFAYVRLKTIIIIKRLNFTKLHLGEINGALMQVIASPDLNYNSQTGDVIDPNQARLELRFNKDVLLENDKHMDSKQNLSSLCAMSRDVLIGLGFVGLVLSKFIGLLPTLGGAA